MFRNLAAMAYLRLSDTADWWHWISDPLGGDITRYLNAIEHEAFDMLGADEFYLAFLGGFRITL